MHVIPFWCAFEVAGFVLRSLNSIFTSFTLHTPLFTSHFSSFCSGMTAPCVRNTASFFCSNTFSTVWFVQFVKIDKSLPYWNWYTIFCIPVLSFYCICIIRTFFLHVINLEKVSTCNICKWDGHNHHEAQWRAADQLHWVSTKLASNPWQFLPLT